MNRITLLVLIMLGLMSIFSYKFYINAKNEALESFYYKKAIKQKITLLSRYKNIKLPFCQKKGEFYQCNLTKDKFYIFNRALFTNPFLIEYLSIKKDGNIIKIKVKVK
jgi:predicted nuclease of restriction endonuclease-like (RecB) superfamily